MGMILEALESPFHDITFRIQRDKDWYFTDDGISANPVCGHAGNPRGVKIKLQVSTRETPILPVAAEKQIGQDYFRFLPFAPAAIPSLAFEEVVAEKIRAASQRSKIRDLHDLSEIAKRPLDQDRIRRLAVLKLWNSGGEGLDYDLFKARIEGAADYDIADLRNLLRRDENPDLAAMIARVTQGFQFLRNLSEAERLVAADPHKQATAEAAELLASLQS